MADKFLEESLVKALGPVLGNDNLGSILLILAILCLGLLYVSVRYSMTETNISPITFVAWRFILSVLIIIILHMVAKLSQFSWSIKCTGDLWRPSEQFKSKEYWSNLLMWGSLAGIAVLCFTFGVQYAEKTQSAAKTAFVIGMYVVVIPFAEMALSSFSYNLPWKSWLALVLVIPGVFILSGCTQTNCFNNFQWGILYNVCAMFGIAAHTLVSARAIDAVGATSFMYFDFGFCAVVSVILAVILEPSEWVYPCTAFTEHWRLIFAAALVEVLAAIFIAVALSIVSTSRAAIVMSLESLSGAVCGYLILGEVT